VKYLGLIIIVWNLRWKIHIKNVVMRLRSITFKLFKLYKFLSTEILYIVYNVLYKSIFQYSLLVWGGCSDNSIKPLDIQQNHAIRICLKKNELYGSTSLNYKELPVIPTGQIFIQSVLHYI